KQVAPRGVNASVVDVEKSVRVFNNLKYFFFQAEDGIRDRNVTGVQTCALPIFLLLTNSLSKTFSGSLKRTHLRIWSPANVSLRRSEERRVGKECNWGLLIYTSKIDAERVNKAGITSMKLNMRGISYNE